MLKNLKNKKKKGFTLIELIIVIAIIAILAAVAIPKFSSISKDAKIKSDIANAKTISNAVSALIAEGEINVPSSDEVTIKVDGNANKGDALDIVNYLQNVPTPESTTDKYFTVIIDASGNIQVKAGEKEFFPNYEDEKKEEDKKEDEKEDE